MREYILIHISQAVDRLAVPNGSSTAWNMAFLAYDTLLFQERQKKWFVQYMKKVLGLIECVKSDLWSIVLEISLWMMLHSGVDKLKLTAIKLRTLIEDKQITAWGR